MASVGTSKAITKDKINKIVVKNDKPSWQETLVARNKEIASKPKLDYGVLDIETLPQIKNKYIAPSPERIVSKSNIEYVGNANDYLKAFTGEITTNKNILDMVDIIGNEKYDSINLHNQMNPKDLIIRNNDGGYSYVTIPEEHTFTEKITNTITQITDRVSDSVDKVTDGFDLSSQFNAITNKAFIVLGALGLGYIFLNKR